MTYNALVQLGECISLKCSWACRSEGFLCLRPPVGGSLSSILEQVFEGEMKEIHRQRLRIKLGSSLLPMRALNEVFIGEKDHSQ